MAEGIESGGETTAAVDYNTAAIQVAERLTAARAARQKGAAAERPIPDRFPPFNRAGLGVALEYERMGN